MANPPKIIRGAFSPEALKTLASKHLNEFDGAPKCNFCSWQLVAKSEDPDGWRRFRCWVCGAWREILIDRDRETIWHKVTAEPKTYRKLGPLPDQDTIIEMLEQPRDDS